MFQFWERVMRLSARPFLFGVLLILFIAVPSLSPPSGFADDGANKPPTLDTATPKGTRDERPPFDLKYVPPDAMGVIAVRPNVIFSDPAMKPLARMANDALTQFLQSSRITLDPKLSIDEIEQVVGYISIIPGGKEKRGIHTLGTGLAMIRTTHDFDWVKLLRQVDPKTEEVRWKGLVCYKCCPPWISGLSPKAHLDCFIPDKRTLVLPRPGALNEGQANEAKRRPPHFSWDKDWKHVERGLFAVALDNRWSTGLSAEQIGGEPWANMLTQHVSTMVAGVNWKDGIDFHAFLSCKDAASAKQAVGVVKDLLAGMAQFREVTGKVDPSSGQPKVSAVSEPQEIDPASLPPEIAWQLKLWKDLVTHARVTQHNSTTCVHAAAKARIDDLVKTIQLYVQ